MSKDTEPKFKVGQIVVLTTIKKELPFRIFDRYWNDGWFYFWNRKNAAAESMLRELNSTEKGE